MASTQMEFPLIKMNRYLWLYRNGVYNVKTDMFFPFAMPFIENLSDVTADNVTAKCREHVINDDDETFDTTMCQEVNGVRVWNKSDSTLMSESFFQIDQTFYVNHCGRESWVCWPSRCKPFVEGCIYLTSHGSQRRAEQIPEVRIGQIPDRSAARTIDDVIVWNIESDETFTVDTLF